jgi:hypothetical protein
MKDDADPLDGWSYDEYITHVTVAKNDVYGAFFFYLQDMLLAFCERIRSWKIAFQLLAVDAMALPSYLKSEDSKFDRIEVRLSTRYLLQREFSTLCDSNSTLRPTWIAYKLVKQ